MFLKLLTVVLFAAAVSLVGAEVKMDRDQGFPVCQEAVRRCQDKAYFRVVLFGASNTERYMPTVHWGDVLEVGLRARFGRKFHLINSGICGNNTREALARFDRDVASFRPDIVIITLGGNDCNPVPPKHVPEKEYIANMEKIVDLVRGLGAIPILQTYYKMLPEGMAPERYQAFCRNMELVREIAARKKVFLIDQFDLFDRLDPAEHRYKLMVNAMHVNEKGNAVIGLRVLAAFGIGVKEISHRERLLSPAELLGTSI